MQKHTTSKLHERYIYGSQRDGEIPLFRTLLCHLTKETTYAISNKDAYGKIFISTHWLKHLYDKRPAVDYDLIRNNIHTIVKYPDSIYRNRTKKRGQWIFRKKIHGSDIITSLETLPTERPQYEIVTSFRIKEIYLRDYNLIWSWEDSASLRRNAFDANS